MSTEESQIEALERLLFEAIGVELRAERRHKSIGQAEAAQIAGLSRHTISDLENHRNQSLATLFRYALALEMPLSLLLARAERRLEERREEAGLEQPAAFARV